MQSRTTTNILDILTSQHDEVDALFKKIKSEKGDLGALFIQLADKLAAHATCEESLFYPAVMAKRTNDMLHESVEEHLEIKRLLADLIAMDVDHDEFKAKMSVLEENVTHHAREEEEQKLFPMLRKTMSEDELSGLGGEYLAIFEKLLPTHPYKNVPKETERAAPLPEVA